MSLDTPAAQVKLLKAQAYLYLALQELDALEDQQPWHAVLTANLSVGSRIDENIEANPYCDLYTLQRVDPAVEAQILAYTTRYLTEEA